MKVASPDQHCIQVDGVTGRRYDAKSGIYDMHPRDAKALMKEGGFRVPNMGTGSRSQGYRCQKCGFGSWFRKCGRCGGDAAREVVNAT